MHEQSETMTDMLVSTLVSAETQLWLQASNHEQLNRMWKARVTQESHGLTERQVKAVAITHAGAYAMAVQAITMRLAVEVTKKIELFLTLKKN